MRMAAFIGAEGDWRLKADEQILFPRRYGLLDKLHTKSGKRMRLRFNVQIVSALIRIDDEASLRRAPAPGRPALPNVFARQLALKQLVGFCRGACIRLPRSDERIGGKKRVNT